MSAEKRAENTVKVATAFVSIKESQHVQDLANQAAMLKDSNDLELAAEGRKIEKKLMKESDRLYSPDQADEEEVVIYNAYIKKKKR
jgi:hypothetical protein